MKKIILIALIFILSVGVVVSAPSSTIVQNLIIYDLKSSGDPCLTIGSDGLIATSTCVGVSLWTATNGDIYRLTGKVGIGTSTPQTALHVIGSSTISGDLIVGGTNFDNAGFSFQSAEAGGETYIMLRDTNISDGADYPAFFIASSTGNAVTYNDYFEIVQDWDNSWGFGAGWTVMSSDAQGGFDGGMVFIHVNTDVGFRLDFTNDQADFFGTNFKLGIGTSTPATALHVIGTTTLETSIISKLAFDPEVSQTITTSTQTILSSASHIDLTINGDFVMTATPTIEAGIDGQLLILHSAETTSTLDLQDDSVLSGSDIFLNGAEGTLKPQGTIMLIYQVSAPTGWSILSNPNSASAGASADLLNVRNVSGSPIAAGKLVYVSGFNVGQTRPTIALADSDDSSKMPAIGVAAGAIANGSNGQVITSGNVIALIDTSGASVGDGVWVSTTAGNVVFTRPAVDDVQRIGTVTRSNATGNILVTGAGRTNDIPINATTTGAYNFGQLFVTGDIQFSNYATGFLIVDASGNLSTSTIDISSDTNLGGGRSITISGDDVVADEELYDASSGVTILNATSSDSVRRRFGRAFTISKVTCEDTGTSTINLLIRTSDSPKSGGTAILNSALTCATVGTASSTSFNDATIPADSYIVIVATTTGNVDEINISWESLWDD